MPYKFLDTFTTPSVRSAQLANSSREYWEEFNGHRAFDRFTYNEMAYIAARDSFYIATVSKTGWPYVQHRGGSTGFLKVLDEKTLGFADFRGNRQYISLGNIAANNRVALMLTDYPNRIRLKIPARMQARDLKAEASLAASMVLPGYKGKTERAFLLHLESFDWNCAQHVVPRFTLDEIEKLVSPLHAKISLLEKDNAVLRKNVSNGGQDNLL